MSTSKQHSCVRGPLQECCSIQSGAFGLPYYCAPLVCVSEVIELLPVCRHNKPKTKKTPPPVGREVNPLEVITHGQRHKPCVYPRQRYKPCKLHTSHGRILSHVPRSPTSPHTLIVLLCFIKPILGNRYVRSRVFIVSEPRETHPRSEITDVPTLPCPPLDNLVCPDPHPAPWLRRWLHRSPPLLLRTDPATTTLTTRGLYPGDSVVWTGPKFVRPHWWRSWVMIRFLEIQSPNCRETLHRPLPKATLDCKKTNKKTW